MSVNVFPPVSGGGGGSTTMVFKANPGANVVDLAAGFYLIEFSEASAYPITLGTTEITTATIFVDLVSDVTNLDFIREFALTEHPNPGSGFNSTRNATAFGNGLFVTVGNTPYVATSPNGITWTIRTVPNATSTITDVIYTNGQFVICGVNSYLATSPDGITWTQRTAPNHSSHGLSLAYGNGVYVLIGGAYPNPYIASSPDGITWTERTAPNATYLDAGVAFTSGVFVIGGRGGYVATSTDGTTWTQRTLGSSENFTILTAGDNVFLGVVGSADVKSSSDGITWSSISYPSQVSTSPNPKFANGLFFIFQGGTAAFSADLSTFVITSVTRTSNFKAVAFGNDVYSLMQHDFFPVTSPGYTSAPQYLALKPTVLTDLT
jgi:hypothetical protein